MVNKNISVELFECTVNPKVLLDVAGITALCLRVAKVIDFKIVEILKTNGETGIDYVLMGAGCCIYIFTYVDSQRLCMECINIDIADKKVEEIISLLVSGYLPKLYKETITNMGELTIKKPYSALFELADGKYIIKKESEEKPDKNDKSK